MAENLKYIRGEANESRLLNQTLALVRESLPSGWTAEMSYGLELGTAGIDARMRIDAPDGTRAEVLIEAKVQSLAPAAAKAAVARLQALIGDSGATGMVVAPFVNPTVRELFRKSATGYVDATGNLLLQTPSPSIWLERSGASKAPVAPDATARTLRGRTASQIVRALIDLAPPLTLQQVALAAEVSLGQASRVVSLLEDDGLVRRDAPRAPIVEVDWRGTLLRWLSDYRFSERIRPRRFVSLRGLPNVLDRLRELDYRYALTGEYAAEQYAPVVSAGSLTIYADDPETLASELDLEPAARSADVMIATPWSPIPFQRTTERNGLVLCAPGQVVADLWGEAGRSKIAAEELLDWMVRDDSWRV